MADFGKRIAWVLALGLMTSVSAFPQSGWREMRHDRREIRHDRAELRQDYRELRRDQWRHNWAAVQRDRAEIRNDRADLRHDFMDARRDRRDSFRDHDHDGWRDRDGRWHR